MDLAKIKTETTHFDDAVECVLYDAAGQPEKDSAGQAVMVMVISAYSAAAKNETRTQKRELGQLGRRYGSWENIPQDELDALDDRAIASCITGWRGFESDGAPFPYSPANAIAVVAGLRATRPRQLAQIEGAIASHAAFFLKPSAA